MMHQAKVLNPKEMAAVAAGRRGGVVIAPTQPIADLFDWIACGGHNWVCTGREAEVSAYFFWTKRQRQYKCTKCGKVEWRDID